MVYYYGTYRPNNYLAHHGILGMKWGVRRFQNKDGTYTSAGIKRYSNGGTKKSNTVTIAKKKRVSDVSKKSDKATVDKNGHKNKKESDQLSKTADKKSGTKHYKSLVEKYKSEGMSRADAEKAAARRLEAEKKVLIGVGAAAVVALGATVAVKSWDKRYAKALLDNTPADQLDDVIKGASRRTQKAVERCSKMMASTVGSDKIKKYASSGIDYLHDRELDLSNTPLHRITKNPDFTNGLSKPFYAAYDKTDRLKYRGLYSNQLRQQGAKKIFDVEIIPKKNIKVAGDESVKSAIRDIIKSKDGSKFVKDALDANSSAANNVFLRLMVPERAAAHDAAHVQLERLVRSSNLSESIDRMSSDDFDQMFKAINVNLSGGGGKVGNRLYSELRGHGFQAINDINDRLFSGYKAKDPLVVIDPSGVVGRVNGRQLSLNEIILDNAEARRVLGF